MTPTQPTGPTFRGGLLRWFLAALCLSVTLAVVLLVAGVGADTRTAGAQGGDTAPSQPEATPTEPAEEEVVDEEGGEERELPPEATPTEPAVEVAVEAEPTPQQMPTLSGPGVIQGEPDDKGTDENQPRTPIYDTPPPTPTDFSADSTTADSVELSWTGALGVARYRITYKGGGVTSWTNIASTTDTDTTVSDLKCNTSYSFRVEALGDGIIWEVDWSNPSSEVAETTDECPPVPAPTGLSATPDQYSVSLSWNKPTDVDVADIVFYRVDQQRSNGTWRIVAYTQKNVTTYERTGLMCNTSYKFRVAARGDGHPYLDEYEEFAEFSESTTSACPPVPAPENLRTTPGVESMSLTWEKPDGVALQDIVFYRVEQQRSNGTWRIIAYTQKNVTSYEQTELTPCTAYSFRVSARGRGKPYLDEYQSFAVVSPTTTCPVVKVSASSSSVTEGESVTFTVSADPVPSGGLSVAIETTRVGSFFSGDAPTTAAIAAGESTEEVVIATIADSVHEDDGSVTVEIVADDDAYTVGTAGSASATVKDDDPELTAPPAPTGLGVTGTTSTSATLSWSQGAGISGYQVEYKKRTSSTWLTHSSTITANSTTIRRLECGTGYNFQVRAHGDGSTWLATWGSYAGTSAPLCKPGPPTGLEVTADTDTSVSLSWDTTAGVSRYRLQYRASGGTWSDHSEANSTARRVSVPTCGTEYEFQVEAWGDGRDWKELWSAPSTIKKTPLCTPDAPTGLRLSSTTTTSVNLTWTDQEGVSLYEAQHKPSTGNWPRGLSGTSVTNSVTISGLTCDTAYHFRVRALGDGATLRAARSSYSEPFAATPPCLPKAEAPDDVSATASNQTSVTLWWSDVDDTNGYRIEYVGVEGSGAPDWTTATEKDVDESENGTYKVTGLTCGLTYHFRVSSRGDGTATADGYGTASAAIERDTTTCPEAQPPSGVSGTSTRTSISLTWSEVTGATEYQVQQKVSGSNWEPAGTVTDLADLPHPVTGLTCGTSYLFQVRAKGDGSPYSTTYGEWSTPAAEVDTSACPDAGPPQNLMATPGQTSVDLTWDVLVGATKYQVEQLVNPVTDEWDPLVPTTEDTEYTVDHLQCETSYGFRVRARGDGSPLSTTYGDASDEVSPRTTGCLAAPQDLDVRPLPSRQAKVSWSPVTPPAGVGPVTYTLQYRAVTPGTPITSASPAWSQASAVRPSLTTTHSTIGIDSFEGPTSPGLATRNKEFQFRVRASARSSAAESAAITIVDNPVLRASGYSDPADRLIVGVPAGKGWGTVEWPAIQGATRYVIRYRQLPPGHDQLNWSGYPDTPASWEEVVLDVSGSSPPITPTGGRYVYRLLGPGGGGLDLGSVYAVHVNYAKGASAFYAARNAYFWTSTAGAGNGQRVATFPLRHRVLNQTYSFRICTPTFPSAEVTDWVEAIEHAFEQWELATDGLVTVTRDTRACPSGELVVPIVQERVRIACQPATAQLRPCTNLQKSTIDNVVVNFIKNIELWKLFFKADRAVSEVAMINDQEPPVSHWKSITSFENYGNILGLVGLSSCPEDAPACASTFDVKGPPYTEAAVTDIYLIRSELGTYPTQLPGTDRAAHRDDILFNNCHDLTGPQGFIYETLVHEAGHALGVGGGTSGIDQAQYHSHVTDSAMSYRGSTPKCSPTPFDILALFAIYQGE